ncbi:uncharacterized protein [Anabrus simplex]|uniref:uncharacterized protein n=1 Tax=Anabrus simplex TaxID=316456 RepID=UPI0035A2B200
MERLIEVVREYPVLYDTTHEDYVKTKVKDEIWRKIASELNYPKGEAAKEQWRKLRDCHRDALRRQKKKIGDATAINKLWIYQKQMEFLLPHMASNFRDSEIMEMAENFTEVGENSGELDNQNDHEVGVNESPVVKKKHKKADEYNILREALDEMIKRSRERDVRRKHIFSQDDPLLQFFMLMYNTAKRMPTASQLKIKRKLFLAVSEEEEIINNQIINNATCTIYGTSSLSGTSGRSIERATAEPFTIYGPSTSQAETSGNSKKEYDQGTGEELSGKVFNF